MEPIRSIVVIGAGQAGASAATKLRSLGFEGELHLIGNEPYVPYQRPPLSKKYLTGEIELERILIKPEAFYNTANIELHLDVEAVAIEPDDNSILLSNGRRLNWDRLLLATGSRPRELPDGVIEAGCPVHVLRNLRDVHQLAPAMEAAKKALIVGGGYIGLEAAAAARHFDVAVTLVEATDRILQRVAAEATSKRFADLHRRHGVDIREGTGLSRVTSLGDGKYRAAFSSGDTLDIDLVLIGIGVIPNAELATAAGLSTNNGISVDDHGRTSNPTIFAAGDCASFDWRGTHLRLESVQNAIDQAEA
ncbi:MAG: FAD-dependent oxidoreductase, partial [Pseudomonadota bacterium]